MGADSPSSKYIAGAISNWQSGALSLPLVEMNTPPSAMFEVKGLAGNFGCAETLHFGRSARLLNSSQPALSQVKVLETELGVQLRARNRQGTVLTEAGQAFREEAAIALEKLEFAKRKAQWVSAGRLGHIRIGFISTAGFEIVPNLMRRLRKSYPDVEFVIGTS